jgi:hydrogenase maturation protease
MQAKGRNRKVLVVRHQDVKSRIKERLVGHLAIVGIGNILRGDDALGPKLIELLKKRGVNADLFDCGTAPENYILPILSASCDTIVLVDAADTGGAPGDIGIHAVEEIKNVSFSTHNPSPRLFADLIKTGKPDVKMFVLSVQPKSASLGDGISDEVLSSLDFLVSVISESAA